MSYFPAVFGRAVVMNACGAGPGVVAGERLNGAVSPGAEMAATGARPCSTAAACCAAEGMGANVAVMLPALAGSGAGCAPDGGIRTVSMMLT